MSTIKMKEFSHAVLDVCKSYYADVDELRAQLAACAAGPWRYDVENAPYNVYFTVWYKDDPTSWFKACRTKYEWHGGGPHFPTMDEPDAFAIPNPPEVKP